MARRQASEQVGKFYKRSILMQRFMHILLLVFTGGLLLLPSGCSTRPEEARQVAYRLKWLFNISVVGDLHAGARGYFADQGLTVTIKPGGPERDAIKELEVGRAQFGVASADQVIRALAKGAPIVVIGQLFQRNPLQWLYRAAADEIDKPQDLKGKTIGITHGGNDETIMRALLAQYGIADREVDLYSVRYDYTPFYRGSVNLWPVYQNAEGIVIAEKLSQEGEGVRFFNPDVFGIRFAANSIVTTRQILEEQPELVTKFMAALLRGWQEALAPSHAAQALATLRKYDRDTPPEILDRQLAATRQLMMPPSGTVFGAIDVAAWKQTEKIMLGQQLIGAPVGVENFLHPQAVSPVR
jgi:NitT/TauT family transport system substrate-binding protein